MRPSRGMDGLDSLVGRRRAGGIWGRQLAPVDRFADNDNRVMRGRVDWSFAVLPDVTFVDGHLSLVNSGRVVFHRSNEAVNDGTSTQIL